MAKDSFVFYRSFYDASKHLNNKDRLNLYDAIVTYAFDGKENTVSGNASIAFILIKPQLDANSKGMKPVLEVADQKNHWLCRRNNHWL